MTRSDLSNSKRLESSRVRREKFNRKQRQGCEPAAHRRSLKNSQDLRKPHLDGGKLRLMKHAHTQLERTKVQVKPVGQ